jgi:hypothetical protein
VAGGRGAGVQSLHVKEAQRIVRSAKKVRIAWRSDTTHVESMPHLLTLMEVAVFVTVCLNGLHSSALFIVREKSSHI